MRASDPPFALPMIDLARLAGGNAAAHRESINAIAAAARRHGFFYVRNHDVASTLQQQVFEQARIFFALPIEKKQLLDKARSRCNRGYEHLGGQKLGSGAPPDLKEGFYSGEDLPESDPRVTSGRFNQGPNQWPADLPLFRETLNHYHKEMMRLAATLMGGLAKAMQLPDEEFGHFMTQPMGTLRLLHYPPQPPCPEPGQSGCGAHTDFGGLTLLLQDECGGLQVRDEQSGLWIDAPPVAGTYVVNLGDLIGRWTNGQFRSNLHRVINTSGQERYSVPFFFSGNPDHLVKCLPWSVGDDEEASMTPVTVEDHLAACYRRTYA